VIARSRPCDADVVDVFEGCRFETDRLGVAPWHEGTGTNALARFVVDLLTPAVTEALPPDWSGAYDEERAAGWITARDAESVVLAARERVSESPVGVLILTAVDPKHPPLDVRIGYLLVERRWGRGLASELVAGFVAWCRSAMDVRSITAGVEADHQASAHVLVKQGFHQVDEIEQADRIDGAGQLYRLNVLPADGVTIRPETAADHHAIGVVVTAAFGSTVETALVERIRDSPEYLPELALVAEVDGQVVGHVMISGAVLRHAHGERPIVMLSPLAVAPDHQRLGIGGDLVRAAVAGAERAGEPLVVLEGNPAYYSRFGFEHSVAHGVTLPLPDWAPSEAGQVVRLEGYDEHDPTMRGEVVYPVAFDGLDAG